MRMFLKVQMDVEATNSAVKDGSISKLIKDFVDAAKPEGIWFTALEGKRSMIAVFDLASPADIPPLAEPFFMTLGSTFQLSPAMDMADLNKGFAQL